ncbi:MAG: acyl-CoA thioesterase [Chromatiaceae bacterium]|nr:acyl-CoA thioesterase [Chromatiaceae bacterium]
MRSAPFEHRFRVALHDTDAAGVLFFGHLFRHAHDAYEALMAHSGLPLDALIRAAEWHLPLVHAEADYGAPLRHGEQVRVTIEVLELGQRAFTLGYRFALEDGREAARARTVHVCIEAAAGVSRPLPESLRAALAPYRSAASGD